MKKAFVLCILVSIFLTTTVWGKIGGGDITFKVNKETGDVIFSHDHHAGKTGLKCKECHELLQISKMSNNATMNSIITGKYCGACHNAKRAFGIKENCVHCHRK
jgi:c(7)-type cytochrome triheme protein